MKGTSLPGPPARFPGRLLDWCTAHVDEMVQLLRRLVDQPSHAAMPDGVALVAEMLASELQPLSFSFEKHPQRPLPTDLGWLEKVMSPEAPYEQLAATYVAHRDGAIAGRLLLLGDLDTAAPLGTATALPFAVRGDKAYGAGVADMKGGLVVLTTALRALTALSVATPAITIVLAGDEQAGSLGSRTVIEDAARSADWCLCVECARDGGRLMHARAHIGVGQVEALGREAHAGSAYADGVNAIEALALVIPRLNALSRPDSGVLVTVTLVSGGRRRSVVPAHATAVLDVRTPDAAAWSSVSEQISAVVREVTMPGTEFIVRLHDHRPGFSPAQGGRQLMRVLREAGRGIGLAVHFQVSAAAGSSAFAGAINVPTIDGLGPAGGELMTPREHVELDSLAPRAALLALAIHSLGSRRSSSLAPLLLDPSQID